VLEIFDAAPFALDKGSVGSFDICPLVKSGEIISAPVGEKAVDGFGILFSSKHGSAFEAYILEGSAGYAIKVIAKLLCRVKRRAFAVG
jgi:hypothetical protein